MTEKNVIEAALYIVPTPIGNLEDITLRAIKVFKNADIIASEDTRRTGQLLKSLDISHKKFISYHDYNERQKAEQIADLILNGQSVALVSDAGTPGISDPAYRLLNACIEKDIKLIPLPGATAFVPALLASGFGTDKFAFLGFPPHKKGRKSFIKKIAETGMTTIIYESPFRVEKLVNEMIEADLGECRICIAREITKLHEEFIRCTVSDCAALLKNHKNLKGEFVLVLDSPKN
jgi:16S rRNA (cytidine1402-2'-O)-methyltransferase